ncbi:MAG TPA: N-acetyltransferase [Candidatus Coprocola pullicola]|nr:N-acetyltransferase [Candidatus Coprocola pullicola]
MKIRFADSKDSKEILKIYQQYIDTTITFECRLPTAEDFSKRVEDISAQYPYLVCEQEGCIVGYAYASRQMQREAYQWNATLSIYLHENITSKGIGKRLYQILIEILKKQGVKTVYAGVTIPNEKSENLHKSLGFQCFGVYRNTGYKCNRWLDVAWFEKNIDQYCQNPAPFEPIQKIPKQELLEILEKYC